MSIGDLQDALDTMTRQNSNVSSQVGIVDYQGAQAAI